jgi:hypothetical protein
MAHGELPGWEMCMQQERYRAKSCSTAIGS